jgi:hypothetical protein
MKPNNHQTKEGNQKQQKEEKEDTNNNKRNERIIQNTNTQLGYLYYKKVSHICNVFT